MKSYLERQFKSLLKQEGLPAMEEEFKFCKDRKWRFDFAYISKQIAVELEGGAWLGKGHTGGKGFIANCEKYNQAVLEGWKVLRYTPETISRAPEDIKKLVNNLQYYVPS